MAKDFIVGRAALLVIDIQASTFMDDSAERSIPNMPGYRDRMYPARPVIDASRAAGIAPIFIQEVHCPVEIDFGRALDGAEDEHCFEAREAALAAMEYLQTGARRSMADLTAALATQEG